MTRENLPSRLADPADAGRAAREHLDPAVWAYLERRADGGRHDRNIEAWKAIELLPAVLRGVSEVDVTTTLLGVSAATPILTAPNGRATRYHPEGERAVMAGAARAGAGVLVGSSASHALGALSRLEAVAPFWSQIYLQPDEDRTDLAVEAAVSAGCHALVATVDLVPGAATARGLPPLERPDWEPVPPPAGAPPLYAGAGLRHLEALVRRSPLPVVVKGILRPDDARACADVGARAVIVSNHGDAQLPGAAATARALPAVAAAVGKDLEVYVDGGVRDGASIVRALALGARAVLVGRPVTYGLAVLGAEGVELVLRALGDDLRRTLALCGVDRLSGIGADLLA